MTVPAFPLPVPPLPAGLVPGYSSARVLELVYEQHAATGDGLTAGEMVARYRERFETTADRDRLQQTLSTLVTRGHAVAVSGRSPNIRYGAPSLPAPVNRDPQGDRLVGAVRALEAALGYAPSTHEVAARLRRDGLAVPSSSTLRRQLGSLTASMRKGRDAWWLRMPRLEELYVETMTGASLVHWRTLGSMVEAPAMVVNESNAARRLVQRAEAAYGRPASRREIAWWTEHVLLNGGPEDRALGEIVPPARLNYWLGNLVERRTRVSPESGRHEVRRVERPSVNAGTHRIRYTFGAEAPSVQPVVDAELTAEAYAVAAECAGLERLAAAVAREAGAPGGEIALAMLTARRRALAEALTGALPPDAAAREAGVAGAIAAAERLAAWVEVPPVLLGRAKAANVTARRATARRRLDDVRALRAVIRSECFHALAAPAGAAAEEPAAVGSALRAGEAATLSHADTRALVEAIAVPVNPTVPKERLTYIFGARRFRIPVKGDAADRGRARWNFSDTVFDRVDVVALAARADNQPRAQTLIERAHDLLGHVVRDAALLEWLLVQHPHAEPSDRRAAVVACGLLGHVPPLDLAVPDASDPLDTRAYVLACALGDPSGAAARIDAADRRARGAACEITDVALGRAESGLLLAVIG